MGIRIVRRADLLAEQKLIAVWAGGNRFQSGQKHLHVLLAGEKSIRYDTTINGLLGRSTGTVLKWGRAYCHGSITEHDGEHSKVESTHDFLWVSVCRIV